MLMSSKEPSALAKYDNKQAIEWLTTHGIKFTDKTQDFAEALNGHMLVALADDDDALKELGVDSALSRLQLKNTIRDTNTRLAYFTDAVDSKRDTCWYRFPIVNLFHDLLFDESPPTNAAIKDILSTFALLSALFITVAMSLPSSVTFEDLEGVRARFDDSSSPYSAYKDGEGVIREFMITSAVSVFALGACLAATIVALVNMSIVEQATVYTAVQRAWYKWNRWVLLWCVLNLIAGVVCTFFQFNRMLIIKFPDFSLEGQGFASFSFFRVYALAYLAAPFVGVMLLSGMSNRSAYTELRALLKDKEYGPGADAIHLKITDTGLAKA